jgi:hypothetical protein
MRSKCAGTSGNLSMAQQLNSLPRRIRHGTLANTTASCPNIDWRKVDVKWY